MIINSTLKKVLPAGILLLLCILCYGNIFSHYYFLDDTSAVYAGYLLSHDLSRIFESFLYIDMSPMRRYMVALSYLPNYLISGMEPWSYYLVSFLLHLGNSVLAYLLVKRLSKDQWLGLLAAVLYCVSLNKADAVMYMANRPTPMGTFFTLLTLLLYLGIAFEGFTWKRLAACLAVYFMAVGSYENSLLVPLLMVVISLLFIPKERRFAIGNVATIALFGLIVLSLSLYLHLGSSATGGSVLTEPTLVGKIIHLFRNILSVLPSFVIPAFVLQSPEVMHHNVGNDFGWIEWTGAAMTAAIVAVNIKLKDRLLWFGLLFFYIGSILTAVPRWVYYPVPGLGDMRWGVGKYSYFASFGVYIIFAVLAYRLYRYLTTLKLPIVALRLVTGGALAAFLVFNIYWIHDREKEWALLEREVRLQTEAVKALQLQVDRQTTIYITGFINYHSHSRALFRVLFDIPDLQVKDVRDYVPGKTTGKSLFLIAEGDRIKVLRSWN